MSHYIKIVVFVFLYFKLSIVAASYSMTELEATALDVPDVKTLVVWDNTDTGYPNDDDKQTVAIGFPFQFDSVLYNNVTILTNGILKFGAIERMHRDYRNETLATDEGDRFVAIYWDDLVDDASSEVTYGSLGTSPNRKFVVNWTNVKAYANNRRYDFQVVLYENGDVRYRYNNNTANGQSATIGLEIDDSDAIQYSFNTNSVETSFDLYFRNQLLALPSPLLQYRLDEISWDGSADEVIDSTLNNLHGRSFLGANTFGVSPAVGSSIGTCNYGEFDGVSNYVEVPDNNLLDLSSEFSVGAWVKINSIPTSGFKTILSKDENYEFHVNPAGQIFWWWRASVSGEERSFNSTTSISAGVWSHIVISFSAGSQRIFINGIESGNFNDPELAQTNSDPLQFASDQNTASRYFGGNIDEVNIFDQALTALQAQELMDVTRPCSSINLCVSSFPDGLSSHSGGTINFGRDAQLFFSPDDVLDASSIIINGASNDRTCVSAECQANGLISDITTPPAFPTTSGFSDNIAIGNNGSGSNDPSINQYNQIDIGNGSTFTAVGSYSDFYIDVLAIGNNTELELLPGNYWIRNLDTGASNNPNSGLEIRVIGSGTVRLYINDDVILGQGLLANSPSQGNQGDASQFMLYSYSNIVIERDSTLSGIIYAAGDVDVQRDGNVFGAIAGDNLTLGRLTNVFYNPSATVDLDFGELCQSASCTLGSFNITQPAYALACPGTRTQISVQAMCDDGTSVKDDYAGTVDLTSSENGLSEFYASLVSVPTISSIVYDGSETGSKDVFLFHQNENSALQVIATDAAIPVSTTSSNFTNFSTWGFAKTDPNSFVCGDSTGMTLTAIGQDSTGVSCQILTGFTGVKALKAWYQVNINAAAGADIVSTSLSIASQAVSDSSEPPANNINLTFANGVASIPLEYPNAGQILAVNFKHDDAPYDNSVAELNGITLNASTSSFVARPDKINLSIAAAANCASADGSCDKFVAAGSDFSLDVEAQCIGGGIADDYQGSIDISHALAAPLPGSLGSLAVESATVAAVDGGSIQIGNQSISEVGVFDISAEDDNYFGQAIPLFTLDKVGRFYPDHFVMTTNSTNNSCGIFSYMDQPGIDIDYTLQAHKFNGGLTQNYKGSFAKATMGLVAENANDGGSHETRLNGFAATNVANWSAGEYLYADTDSFTRLAGNPDGSYSTLQVGVKFVDNDGDVSSLLSLDMNAGESTTCGVVGDCDAKFIGGLDIRFGQLKLSNVFGPETFDLDMAVRTEYFDGTDFILNTDDNCTNLGVTNPPFTPSNWTGNLADGDSVISLNSDIASGIGVIRFDAAGLGNEGSVLFNYSANSWLKTENTGPLSYDDDAVGKVTFGQYRGNDRMIYWREVVR